MSEEKAYLAPLIEGFEALANPDNAVSMEAYMKHIEPYLGIKTPERKELTKSFVRQYGLPKEEILHGIIKGLWEQPYREYKYTAIEILRKMMQKLTWKDMELLEYMVQTKPWWDTIDGTAVWLMGGIFKKHPEMIASKTGEWVESGNFWLQRCALLFQLKYKDQVDQDLMFAYILELKEEKEFFIRKAIGWILREYSKTNPEAVAEFVENTQLSGLSRREALKWIEKG